MAAPLRDWDGKPQVSHFGAIQKTPISGKLSRAARLSSKVYWNGQWFTWIEDNAVDAKVTDGDVVT